MKLFSKFIIGSFVCLVLFFIFIVAPISVISHIRVLAKEGQCSDMMTKLSVAIDGYRQDHDGAYPPDFKTLDKYINNSFLNDFLNHDGTWTWTRPIYRIPDSNEHNVPISWTGRENTRNSNGIFSRTVCLLADGSVEVLKDHQFVEVMRKYGIDPNNLNQN